MEPPEIHALNDDGVVMVLADAGTNVAAAGDRVSTQVPSATMNNCQPL